MKHITKFLLLIALSVVLAACGGDSSSGTTDDTNAEAANEQVVENDTTDTNEETEEEANTTNTEETENTAQEVAAEDSEFQVDITGSVTSTIADTSAEVFCSEDAFFSDPENATPIIQLTGGDVYGEYVRLYIPYGTEAGTYPLFGELGASLEASEYQPFPRVGTAFIFYNSNDSVDWDYGEGTITLASLPTGGGEIAQGDFSIELLTTDSDYEEGSTVTLTGEFEYAAESFDFTNDVETYTENPCE